MSGSSPLADAGPPASAPPISPEPDGPAPLSPTPLRKRIFLATSWTVVGQGLSHVVRLASSLILTRLLVPEVYGLMELVFVLYTGLGMFSDLGIEPSIIQSPRGDDPRFLNTAWTIQVVRGAILFVVCILLAGPYASAMGEPDLALLIPAIAVTALLDGFVSMAVHTEIRHLRMAGLVKLDLITQVLSTVIQMIAALIWPNAWSLVVGSWVGSLTRMVASHLYLSPHRHALDWDRSAARELFGFSRWIFLSTAMSFIGSQGDRLILARLLDGLGALGVYAVAMRLKGSVQGLHVRLLRAVLLPAIAERYREATGEEADRRRDLLATYYRGRLRLDALFVTSSGFLATFGYVLVSGLYREEYHDAGWILQILALELALGAATNPSEAVLTTIGETKHYFLRSSSKAVFIVLGLPIGWWLGGFWGLVWAAALAETPAALIAFQQVRKFGLFDLRRELLAVGFFVLGAALGLMATALHASFFAAS